MRKFTLFIILLAGTATGGAEAYAQQQARVPGLEKDTGYMQLLGQQQQLKSAEDSTLLLITGSRKAFEDNTTDRAKIGQDIVRLEGELFEIRNRMGKITSQVASMEQNYILSHIDGSSQVAENNNSSVTQSKTLFANSFFTSNLSKNDIALFSVTPKIEPEVVKINRSVAGLYEQLTTLKRQYDTANDQDIIDSLAQRAAEVKEQIEQVDTQMEKLWLAIYSRKIDSYLVLMDKLETVERLKLEQLDQESRQVRRAEGLAGEQLAPLVATYPFQKRLALDYEITMAEALGLKLAQDSLAAVLKKIPADNDAATSYPDILFAPRNLVVYGPIIKTEDIVGLAYKTVAEIPALHIPKQGIYYTIQLGAYTVLPNSLDIFKGMTPLMQQKMSDGKTRYMAGGFSAYSEAQAALNQMIRAGFKAATIIAYADGKATTAIKAKVLETASKPALSAIANKTNTTKSIGAFSVEIIPAELRLPAAMRETIAAKAPGKAIVRGTAGSEVAYSVGGFDTKAEAEALVEALKDQPNVKIKIVTL